MRYLTTPIEFHLDITSLTQLTVENIIIEAEHMTGSISQIQWKYRVDNNPVQEQHPEQNTTPGNFMTIQAAVTDENKTYYAICYIGNYPQQEISWTSDRPLM